MLHKSKFIVPFLALLALPAFAGGEKEFFQGLQGCFQITFSYVEDGIHDQKVEKLVEWIAPSPAGIPTSLQHVGVMHGHAFKHWHEEWTENAGHWTQKVVGPRGDFRYECTASIDHGQWSCLSKKAPIPRRDKEQGRTYESLDRLNTLQVTPKGWVQSENNTKWNSKGEVESKELGWNHYVRIPEENCKAGIDFLAKMNSEGL